MPRTFASPNDRTNTTEKGKISRGPCLNSLERPTVPQNWTKATFFELSLLYGVNFTLWSYLHSMKLSLLYGVIKRYVVVYFCKSLPVKVELAVGFRKNSPNHRGGLNAPCAATGAENRRETLSVEEKRSSMQILNLK